MADAAFAENLLPGEAVVAANQSRYGRWDVASHAVMPPAIFLSSHLATAASAVEPVLVDAIDAPRMVIERSAAETLSVRFSFPVWQVPMVRAKKTPFATVRRETVARARHHQTTRPNQVPKRECIELT